MFNNNDYNTNTHTHVCTTANKYTDSTNNNLRAKPQTTFLPGKDFQWIQGSLCLSNAEKNVRCGVELADKAERRFLQQNLPDREKRIQQVFPAEHSRTTWIQWKRVSKHGHSRSTTTKIQIGPARWTSEIQMEQILRIRPTESGLSALQRIPEWNISQRICTCSAQSVGTEDLHPASLTGNNP